MVTIAAVPILAASKANGCSGFRQSIGPEELWMRA